MAKVSMQLVPIGSGLLYKPKLLIVCIGAVARISQFRIAGRHNHGNIFARSQVFQAVIVTGYPIFYFKLLLLLGNKSIVKKC